MTQPRGKQKQTLRAAVADRRKVTKTVWIGGDDDLADRYEAATQRRRRQENNLTVRGVEATDADRLLCDTLVAEENSLKEALRETCIKFVFEPMGPKPMDKLLELHPPTPEQVEKAKLENVQINFNPETFPAALIDACCVQPEHQPGELEALIIGNVNEFNTAEINDLFSAALFVNHDRRRHDLGKG